MRKSLLIIGSTVLIVALCTYGTTSKNRVQKLDKVTYSEGNTIGANGAGNGQAYAQTGCFNSSSGVCHGTKVSKSTTGTFTGLPANGQVVAGQTYQLTMVVADIATTPTESRWGFDIFSTDGTFATTHPDIEVDTNWVSNGLPGAEIHHSIAPTKKATKTANSYTFNNMSWTAPNVTATEQDTFYYAANAAYNTGSVGLQSTKDHSMLGTPIVLTVTPSTTPVTLTSFNVAYSSNKVALSWATATEINTDHFEIERGTNTRNLAVVGKVKATGNSSSEVNYNYEDIIGSLSGTIYYRLKSVDKNGVFNYSSIKTVVVNSKKNIITNIYPNPASEGQTIKVNYTSIKSGNVNVEMISILGKKVYNNVLPVTEGSNILSLLPSHLPAGLYYIAVVDNTGATQRMPIVIR